MRHLRIEHGLADACIQIIVRAAGNGHGLFKRFCIVARDLVGDRLDLVGHVICQRLVLSVFVAVLVELEIVVDGVVEVDLVAVFHELGVDRVGIFPVAGVHPAAVGSFLRRRLELHAVRVSDRGNVSTVVAGIGIGGVLGVFEEGLHDLRNGDAVAGILALERIGVLLVRDETVDFAAVNNDLHANVRSGIRLFRLVDILLAVDLDGRGNFVLVERRKLLIRPIRSFGVFHKLLIVLGVLRVGQPTLDRDLGVVLRLRQQQVFVLDDGAAA